MKNGTGSVWPRVLAALVVILATAAAGDQEPVVEHLQGSRVFSDGVGFAWGTRAGHFALARTVNGGATWKRIDIHPVMPDVTTTVFVHFANADRGWLVWSLEDETLHLAVTGDSGATWREVFDVQTDAVLERVLYPGKGRSCLLAQMHEGMSHADMFILATDDDGATWYSTRLAGDGVTDWMFRTPTSGFASVFGPNRGNILFYGTTDGGKTWPLISLPLPQGISENDVEETRPGKPVFWGPGTLNGSLAVTLRLAKGDKKITYSTTDGGLSWRPD